MAFLLLSLSPYGFFFVFHWQNKRQNTHTIHADDSKESEREYDVTDITCKIADLPVFRSDDCQLLCVSHSSQISVYRFYVVKMKFAFGYDANSNMPPYFQLNSQNFPCERFALQCSEIARHESGQFDENPFGYCLRKAQQIHWKPTNWTENQLRVFITSTALHHFITDERWFCFSSPCSFSFVSIGRENWQEINKIITLNSNIYSEATQISLSLISITERCYGNSCAQMPFKEVDLWKNFVNNFRETLAHRPNKLIFGLNHCYCESHTNTNRAHANDGIYHKPICMDSSCSKDFKMFILFLFCDGRIWWMTKPANLTVFILKVMRNNKENQPTTPTRATDRNRQFEKLMRIMNFSCLWS